MIVEIDICIYTQFGRSGVIGNYPRQMLCCGNSVYSIRVFSRLGKGFTIPICNISQEPLINDYIEVGSGGKDISEDIGTIVSLNGDIEPFTSDCTFVCLHLSSYCSFCIYKKIVH